MRRAAGVTLIEVMIAALITSLVAAGTFTAFVASARMERAQNNPQNAEAADYAQQTIERYRSNIACSPGGVVANSPWFDANCTYTGPVVWQDDALPDQAGVGTGNRSLLNIPSNPAPARRYCVTPQDCDGDGTVGDCYSMQVRLCWNGTACPAVGAGCP